MLSIVLFNLKVLLLSCPHSFEHPLQHLKIIYFLFFAAFYVDCDAPAYCFVPCGHMASAKTVKYWSEVPIPCGTSGFQSACPFCAVPLTGTPGYVKLIFQAMSD